MVVEAAVVVAAVFVLCVDADVVVIDRPEPPQPATNTSARSGSAAATAPNLPGKAVGSNERRNLALDGHFGRGAETHEGAAALAKLRRLLLLEDVVDSVPPRRVEKAPLSDPERDVVSSLRRAVGDEVAGAEVALRQALARLLLLVGVAWHEAPAGPECHVDEAGAVDPCGGHPAPLVARAEQRACLLDGIGCDGPQPLGIRLSRKILAPRPARICVGGLHANPVATLLQHPQGLPGESLGHLLGVLRGLGPERRELACERMFA